MECPSRCGGNCPLPTEGDYCIFVYDLGLTHHTEDPVVRCNKCKAAVTSVDSTLDALRIGQEALEKATALQFSDTTKSLQLTTNIIPLLDGAHILPSTHPRLALTRLHQSLLLVTFPATLTQDALDNLIHATAASANALAGVLRQGHPIRALAFAELGKLLAVDEPAPDYKRAPNIFPPSGPGRLSLAYETLVKARNELFIGFGTRNEGGEVGREIREMAVRLEKEMQVWQNGVKNALEDRPKKR
jgi:hypothetical protein